MPSPKGVAIPSRVAARAATRFRVDRNGCHISTYSVASHGYAQIGWHENGKTTMTTAHRAAWAHFHGQPGLLTVDHLPTCDRRCVKKSHLRLLTNFENGRRTRGRDWPLGKCINGHPNTELRRDGKRWRCRICRNKSQRERRARSR